MAMMILVGAVIGVGCVLLINGIGLYFCLRRRSQYKKIKERMTELQINVAASQGMSLFQMVNDPQFPRTTHI